MTADGSGKSYTFDGENRILATSGTTYTYDGEGERVAESSGTLYWGDLAESDSAGNLTSEYVFVGGQRVARRDVATASVYYYLQDLLGSSNVVTNAQGVIQNESDFYPFGGENQIANNLPNQKYKFTGKERDTESGNDYFGARYYSSTLGRFLSPDWAAKAEPIPYAKLGNPSRSISTPMCRGTLSPRWTTTAILGLPTPCMAFPTTRMLVRLLATKP